MIITPGQLTHRANFYFQLASLLSAGVPIMQALEMARASESRAYRDGISSVLDYLNQGSTLTDALNATGNWLPVFDRALLAAGEKSGRLDSSFRSLGDYYTARAAMLRQLISGAAYPVFVAHFAVLIFPTSYLTNLFLSNGLQAFIFQKTAVLLPCYILLAFIVFAFQGTHGEHWRSLLERFTNGIPLLGSARRDLALARLSAALEALLSAGVPIIQAWDLAATATASPRLRRTVSTAIPLMEAGILPSDTLKQSSAFPELFRSLYRTGEVSGQLDQSLHRLQNHYEEQGALKIQNLASWTPKIIFLIIAITIGYQVIKFYSGYFDQINQLGL
jgi:type II secretory pathway component PulF